MSLGGGANTALDNAVASVGFDVLCAPPADSYPNPIANQRRCPCRCMCSSYFPRTVLISLYLRSPLETIMSTPRAHRLLVLHPLSPSVLPPLPTLVHRSPTMDPWLTSSLQEPVSPAPGLVAPPLPMWYLGLPWFVQVNHFSTPLRLILCISGYTSCRWSRRIPRRQGRKRHTCSHVN